MKRGKQSTRKGVKTKTRVRTRVRKADGMSSVLHNHMHMVVDPCNAPITESSYPNSTGVLRHRTRQVNTSTHTPASTPGTYARVVAYHPILGAYQLGTAAGGNNYPDAASAQHFSFLSSLSRFSQTSPADVHSARGIGACLSMAWGGKELDRRGVIYSGVVSGALLWTYIRTVDLGGNQTVSANQLAGMLTTTCRTPNDKCEVTWVPTEFDENWLDPPLVGVSSSGSSQDVFAKVNFVIMVGIFSQAVNENVTIVETAVTIMEANPVNQTSTSLWIQDAAHVSTSGFSGGVTAIVRALQKKDPAWYINSAKKIASFGLKALSSYARGGALGLVAEIGGLSIMPRRNVSS